MTLQSYKISSSQYTLSYSVKGKKSVLCTDRYIVANLASFTLQEFFFEHDEYNTTWMGPFSSDNGFDIDHNGFRVFRFNHNILVELSDVWETIQLFLGALIGSTVPKFTAEENLNFLKDHMV